MEAEGVSVATTASGATATAASPATSVAMTTRPAAPSSAPVTGWQREAARKRGARPRNAGKKSAAWKTFRCCGRLFDPAIELARAAERAWYAAREAADTGDAAAAAQLPALQAEYQRLNPLFGGLIYNTLHGGQPLPLGVISSDSEDEGDYTDSGEE